MITLGFLLSTLIFFLPANVDMVELADTFALRANVARHTGSSPVFDTSHTDEALAHEIRRWDASGDDLCHVGQVV